MVKQATVTWSSASGARGGVSVFHFADATSTVSVRAGLIGITSNWATLASDQWSASFNGEVRTLNTETGQLTAIATAAAYTHPGEVAAEAVADATCALLQYFTDLIHDGHRLRGRTYVPGLPATALEDGQWSPATLTALQGLATQFSNATGSAIWARPKYDRGVTPPVLSRPGALAAVTDSNAWAQCAVLRHRRQA